MTKVADTSIPGFGNSCKVSRSSANTAVVPISFAQVMESADAIRLQGQVVTFSFWAKQGANYSPTAGPTVNIITGTGTNQAATSLVAGTWTNQANVSTSVQPLSTTMTRYQVTGTVPLTCTQIGVQFVWTPVGTAGADDSITFNGLQLETGATATNFEHRDAQVELEICQRYCWVVQEPAATVVVATGSVSATNTEIFYAATPVQLYAAPTVTTVVGSFKSNSSTAGVVAATGLAGNTTHTTNAIGLTSTGTGTAGQAALLQGGGGVGYFMASADF